MICNGKPITTNQILLVISTSYIFFILWRNLICHISLIELELLKTVKKQIWFIIVNWYNSIINFSTNVNRIFPIVKKAKSAIIYIYWEHFMNNMKFEYFADLNSFFFQYVWILFNFHFNYVSVNLFSRMQSNNLFYYCI